MRTKGLWLIPLLALTFLTQLPLPSRAACPGSCSNTYTSWQAAACSSPCSSFTMVLSTPSTPSAGNFMVAGVSCVAGNTVSSITDGSNTWTKDVSGSTGSAGNNPVIASFWHAIAGGSGSLTVTINLSSTGACQGEAASYDIASKYFVDSFSQGAVYVCTVSNGLSNTCDGTLAGAAQTYTHSFTDAGSSLLVVNELMANASGSSAPYGSCNAPCGPGWNATGPSQNFIFPSSSYGCSNLSPMVWGSNCNGFMTYGWRSSLSSYTTGGTLNIGNPIGNNVGAFCGKGVGGKCYAQVGVLTAIYSDVSPLVYVTVPCTFNQLQCWWYPMFFMLAFSGLFLFVAGVSRVPPKQAMHLFLSGLTFGSVVAVIFGIMTIALPLVLIILNTLYVVRFRGR